MKVKVHSRVLSFVVVIVMISTMLPFGVLNISVQAALSGSTNAEIIWNYFKGKGFSDCGVGGLMGNIKGESGFVPNNLQNTYERSLGYSDSTYTAAVDNGSYSKDKFVYDQAGYGLCQWTYWSRKKGLYEFVKGRGSSISDFEAQLDYCYKELSDLGLVYYLQNATDLYEVTVKIMTKFENPADQSQAAKNKRYEYSLEQYNKFSGSPVPDPEPSTSSHEVSSNYPTNFAATAKGKYTTLNYYFNAESGHYVDAGDAVTIYEVYTDGHCFFRYPTSTSTRDAYGWIEWFDFDNVVPETPTTSYTYYAENYSGAPTALCSESYNGHTYTLYASSYSWNEAKNFCEANGGYLATVCDAREAYIVDDLSSYYSGERECVWLGAESTSGSWKWVTGEDFTYSRWGDSQPDHSGNREFYLGYRYNEKSGCVAWNDFENVYPSTGFIMEKRQTASNTTLSDPPKISINAYTRENGHVETEESVKVSVTDSKRIEALALNYSGYSGGITYKAHLSHTGWTDYYSNGALIGNTDGTTAVEAVKIKLTGDITNYYNIYYRTYVYGNGWTGWTKNGEISGSIGGTLPITRIEVLLTPIIRYHTHVQDYDWTDASCDGAISGTIGESKRVEALYCKLHDLNYLGVCYQTHSAEIGWSNWRYNGDESGSTGAKLRMEAFSVTLYNDYAEYYDVLYRAHVEDDGWKPWVRNGEVAGTVGKSKQLEAICVMVVPKGMNLGESTYSEKTPSVYRVNFDANGGTCSVTGIDCNYLSLFGNNNMPVATREKYSFLGWYTARTGGTKITASTIFDQKSDITLYAHWEEIHKHSYTAAITTQPTCTANGVKTYTCSCGNSYTETVPATGHDYDAVITDPTCETAGFTTYTCKRCPDTYTADETAALGHDIVTDVAVEPTCTETGLTAGEHCTRCDYAVAQEVVPALGHDFDDTIEANVTIIEPTETEDGSKTVKCVRCSETYSTTISCDEILEQGTVNNGVNWILYRSGKLVVFGNGSVYSKPWDYCKEKIRSLEIGSGITCLSSDSFSKCINLTKVTFENESHVDELGMQCFYGCSSLREITIPSSVKRIDMHAFDWCSNLSSVDFEKNSQLKSIEDYAFINCKNLLEMQIPTEVSNIGYDAFSGDLNLERFIVSNDNMHFSNDESGVLYNKDKTVLIQYPIGRTSSGYMIPTSVHTIAYAAFESASLSAITFDTNSKLSIIMPSAFSKCEELCYIQIPASIESIGNFAFYGCEQLKSIIIEPNSKLENIGESAFGNCKHLENVILTGVFTCIERDAFSYCEKMKSISIPGTVTEIKNNAFYICGLSDVYYFGSEENWAAIEIGLNNEKLTNATIHCHVHIYANEITVPATCTTEGVMTYTCSCGDSYTETIPATGHHYNAVITAPTCTAAGYTTYTCKDCPDTYTADETAALGHDIVTDAAVAPNCTETGLTAGEHCTRCDYAVTQTVVPATGHHYDAVVTAPTCTAADYTTYTCKDCPDTYTADENAALGHDFDESIPANVTIVNPTGSKDGSKTVKCSRCDEVQTTIIPKTGEVDPNAPQFVVSNVKGNAGQTVSVPVNIANNPGIIATRLYLTYDRDVLTLESVTDGGILGTDSMMAGTDLTKIPYTVFWENALSKTNFTESGTLVTFTFRISDDAPLGVTEISIDYDEGSTFDLDTNDIHFELVNGSVEVTDRIPGDANNDGVLNLKDVVLIRRWLAGWDVTIDESSSDVNADGTVNLKDVVLLKRFLSGEWDVEII